VAAELTAILLHALSSRVERVALVYVLLVLLTGLLRTDLLVLTDEACDAEKRISVTPRKTSATSGVTCPDRVV